jgi:hypothetical protein
MKDVILERRRQRIAARKKLKAIERQAENGTGGGLFGREMEVCGSYYFVCIQYVHFNVKKKFSFL